MHEASIVALALLAMTLIAALWWRYARANNKKVTTIVEAVAGDPTKPETRTVTEQTVWDQSTLTGLVIASALIIVGCVLPLLVNLLVKR